MKQLQNLSNANKTYLALAVFAVLIAVFYGNTLFNGFVGDDIGYIETNASIRSVRSLPLTFTTCMQEIECRGRSFYYRPMYFVPAILTYQVSSQPWFFHLMNLLYFFTIGSLVFLLAKLLTKNFLAAFGAGLLFLVHPIQNEVVNYISALPELQLTIFVLLAAIFYILYRARQSFSKLALVYIFYLLALFSKESAILLPAAILSLDVLFFKFKVKNLLRASELKKYLFFLVPTLIYLLARFAVVGGGSPSFFGSLSLTERVYAVSALFAQYIAKLFYPYPLSAFHIFAKKGDLGSLSFLLSFAVLVLFFGALVLFIRKRKNLLAFSFIWFVLFLSLVLIFLGGRDEHLFAERYLFLPSIGFSLLGGVAFSYAVSHSPKAKRAAIAVLLFLVLASWFIIFPRNLVWKSNQTLYTASLEQNPDLHGVRRDLGYIYLGAGELEHAKKEFEEIIQRAPDWKDVTMAYKGLGDYYRAQGDPETALEYYETAGKTSFQAPRDYVVYNDIGALRMNKGEYLKGFAAFCHSLGLYSESAAAQDNFNGAFGLIESEYIQKGVLYEKILEEFTKTPDENIVFQDKRCDEKSCEYAFSFQAQQFEVLPPFLITAATASGKELEIINKGFNPETGVIVLELDSKHKDQTLTFLFPTCQGIYYEAVAKP